ncbi:hypothetical protein J7426_14300 [Tropicibacter sp. R16_0]|uniref:hypothetical protein n=1 Tax=Tropicibacter sp. R16_0 TaxID=2821102 RepID=UPI001ADD1662|nr:hypothetical protein [Tropicibacter sp. R16_0]MBO9451441.1 hypothetical protein [Tropicibacter sp. R16_0]
MRRVSLNARRAADAPLSSEAEVALFAIEHPSLDAPIRLSTDPTERISVEPLVYGTRSPWAGANVVADPYLFVLASAELPSDLEDAPAAGTIVLENVDNRISQLLRGFTDRPRVHMAVVLASSVHVPEVQYRDLHMMSSNGDFGEVRIQMSRQPIEDETVPMDRFTKFRFPGLFA